MAEYVLFLSGRYHQTHLDRYKQLCDGRVMIAVDAGYRFFEKVGLVPDLLIGD
ncbi:hypothetical protein GF377_09265, partial [candidate division GN15 bacterium]|nr:hypothetical protein [candidate division GN15 bacterium]